jgi:alkylhydroperoxidase family enzyme
VSYGSQEVQVGAGEFVSNLLRAISVAPDVAALQWPMRKACREGLDKRVAELAISAVAAQCRNPQVWSGHAPRLVRRGLSLDQIRGLRDGDLTSLDEADRALVTLAQAIETCTVTDERWAAASRFLSQDALAHIVLLVSYYAMLCRIQFAYDVPLDEGLVGMAYPDTDNTLPGT